MSVRNTLPPGQREIDHFPRFGLTKFARRFKAEFDPLELSISGDVKNPVTVDAEALNALPRVEQESDFHCVTTWTKRGLHWSGYRFIDFYETIILPKVQPSKEAAFVLFRCQDGFRSIIPLADLLSDDVLLADRLEDTPLCAIHGAPLRLVTPAHYGYKSAKHVNAIEFWPDQSKFNPPAFRFMGHSRGRVAFEERGTGVPGWLLRFVYRPLVKPTIRLFERTMR